MVIVDGEVVGLVSKPSLILPGVIAHDARHCAPVTAIVG